jgi:hypothetical protein
VLLAEGAASPTASAAVHSALRQEVRRGLRRFPGHPGLGTLARKLRVAAGSAAGAAADVVRVP